MFRVKTTYGVVWQQGNTFHIVELILKEPTLKGFAFPTLIKDEEVPAL